MLESNSSTTSQLRIEHLTFNKKRRQKSGHTSPKNYTTPNQPQWNYSDFRCTDSLMKRWLSSLDRKTLDPSVSLLMSAISWPQSPNCNASTLDTREYMRTEMTMMWSRISGTYLMLTLPLTFLIGHHCSLYWPPIGSWYQLTCCPQRPCC